MTTKIGPFLRLDSEFKPVSSFFNALLNVCFFMNDNLCVFSFLCMCFSSQTNDFLRECQGVAMLENDPCRSRSRLNERERRQAAIPLLVFGNEMVKEILLLKP